jgi:hypothetical protein
MGGMHGWRTLASQRARVSSSSMCVGGWAGLALKYPAGVCAVLMQGAQIDSNFDTWPPTT